MLAISPFYSAANSAALNYGKVVHNIPEELYDVVLQSTGVFDATLEEWEINPLPPSDTYIADGVSIGPYLPHRISSKLVFSACEPAGLNFNAIRQFGLRYTLIRKVQHINENILQWDHDNLLGKILFISRLIHPTTIASCYSARLIFDDDTLTQIIPGRVQGLGTNVWIVANAWRDWLSISDVEHLRNAVDVYINDPPERIRRARSRIDQAFHSYYMDQRTASIVSAFESLLKVEKHQATRQFKLRVNELARKVNLTISSADAESFYDDRSVFVHGREPNYRDMNIEIMERYNRFETVLRRTLLLASTDSSWSGMFRSDQDVIANFGPI